MPSPNHRQGVRSPRCSSRPTEEDRTSLEQRIRLLKVHLKTARKQLAQLEEADGAAETKDYPPQVEMKSL